MIKLQATIKNNHTDLTSYMNDLTEWTAGKHVAEKKIKGSVQTTKPNAQLPPIRNKIDISESVTGKPRNRMPHVPELEKYKRDNTAMPDYYKAWDKFTKKLDDMEDDAEDTTSFIKPVP